MSCSKCGADNIEGARFCRKCGTLIPVPVESDSNPSPETTAKTEISENDSESALTGTAIKSAGPPVIPVESAAIESHPEKKPIRVVTTGLSSNVNGTLSYFLGWITGLVFYMLEKKDDFVRFHAAQSMVTFGSLSIILFFLYLFTLIGGAITIFFAIVSWLLGLGSLVLWGFLMYQAYRGQKYNLPVVGELAQRIFKTSP